MAKRAENSYLYGHALEGEFTKALRELSMCRYGIIEKGTTSITTDIGHRFRYWISISEVGEVFRYFPSVWPCRRGVTKTQREFRMRRCGTVEKVARISPVVASSKTNTTSITIEIGYRCRYRILISNIEMVLRYSHLCGHVLQGKVHESLRRVADAQVWHNRKKYHTTLTSCGTIESTY